MIYFGAGIGLGMIQDGAPFRGAFGNAGEIGHIVITPNGRSCACGRRAASKPMPPFIPCGKNFTQQGLRTPISTRWKSCMETATQF